MGRGAERGGETGGGVRAQRSEAASPFRSGGMWADEVALVMLEELAAGDHRGSCEEAPNRKGRETLICLSFRFVLSLMVFRTKVPNS